MAKRIPIAVRAYSVGSMNSGGMMSSNPTAGIYETGLARTLDANTCGNPATYQGGVMIVEVYEEDDDISEDSRND